MSPAAFNHKYANNRQVHGTLANLPADASSGFGPGCQYINSETGDTYVNLGTASHAMFRCPGVNRYVLTENFLQRPALKAILDGTGVVADAVANHNFAIIGTNMTTALVTHALAGGITITTAGADADSSIVLPSLSTDQTAWSAAGWNTDYEPSFEATVLTGSAVTATTIWAGFKTTNTPVIATDNNQAMFRFTSVLLDAAVSAYWQTIDTNNNVADNTNVTTLAVAAATSYRLRIQVDTTLIPRYYVNGVLLATGLALKAATTLIPYVGILASGTAPGAKALTVRSLTCGQSFS